MAAMAYRPGKEPQTAWARHLDRVRRDRDWSATQLFEAVREPLGLGPKSRSAFVDRLHLDPRPAYIPALTALFGAPEPEPTKEPGPSQETGLAAALVGLTAELAAWRQERATMQARLEELEATVALLVQRVPDGQGTEAPQGHDAPAPTGE